MRSRKALGSVVPCPLEIPDPLFASTSVTHQKMFYPHGFPARLSSNSALVMKAAEASWSGSRQRFDRPPLDIRCFVADSKLECSAGPGTFRSQGHLISIVVDHENFASLDVNTGLSFAWVTTATAQNMPYLRYMFLEAMAYTQLEIRDLASVHAACVSFEGRGVLLAGDSGAGKSTLAYACATRGWTYVSDDASAFVRTSEKLDVLGVPSLFRFREAAATLFPEFQETAVSCRPGGKQTLAIETSQLPHIATAQRSRVHAVVFLDRMAYVSGPPSLVPVTEEEAWTRLTSSLFEIQHPAYEERLETFYRLLQLPTFVFRYRELDAAVSALRELALRSPV